MTTNDKTLADAQPGGRVRLGYGLPEAVAQALATVNEAANDARHAGNYKVANALVTARVTLSKQLLALSAQPSPGGQDVLFIEELAELRRLVPSVNQKHALDAAIAALAARQPVGQIDEAAVLRRAAAVLDMWEGDSNQTGYMGDFKDAQAILEVLAQNAAPPAQAAGEPMRSDLSGYAVAASQVRRGYDVECDRCGKFCDEGPGPCQPVGQAVDLGQFRQPVQDWLDDAQASMEEHGDYDGVFGYAIEEGTRLLALIDSQAVGNG